MARKKKELLEKTIDEIVEYAFKTGQIDKDLYNIDKDLIINAGLTGLKGTTDQLLIVIGLLREFAVNTFRTVAFEEAIKDSFNMNNEPNKKSETSSDDLDEYWTTDPNKCDA